MQLSKEQFARKIIYNGCSVQIEHSVTRDNCLASLGKPRDIIFDSQVDPLTGDNKSDLNDSVTQLKQLVCNDDGVPANCKTAKTTPYESNTGNQQICCETCKIKQNSKKYYNMTRCPLCVLWFHDTCVGLGKMSPLVCGSVQLAETSPVLTE